MSLPLSNTSTYFGGDDDDDDDKGVFLDDFSSEGADVSSSKDDFFTEDFRGLRILFGLAADLSVLFVLPTVVSVVVVAVAMERFRDL